LNTLRQHPRISIRRYRDDDKNYSSARVRVILCWSRICGGGGCSLVSRPILCFHSHLRPFIFYSFLPPPHSRYSLQILCAFTTRTLVAGQGLLFLSQDPDQCLYVLFAACWLFVCPQYHHSSCSMVPPNWTHKPHYYCLLIPTDQAAQNIAAAHLSKPCSFMPEPMQHSMDIERHKKGASKAGQNYWVKACDVSDVFVDVLGGGCCLFLLLLFVPVFFCYYPHLITPCVFLGHVSLSLKYMIILTYYVLGTGICRT
jgi:hypothetical protein